MPMIRVSQYIVIRTYSLCAAARRVPVSAADYSNRLKIEKRRRMHVNKSSICCKCHETATVSDGCRRFANYMRD